MRQGLFTEEMQPTDITPNLADSTIECGHFKVDIFYQSGRTMFHIYGKDNAELLPQDVIPRVLDFVHDIGEVSHQGDYIPEVDSFCLIIPTEVSGMRKEWMLKKFRKHFE